MTAVQKWTHTDKREWGAGPWQDEPDKLQWVDDATGLDCLMVRGPHGGWCGYVGVAEGHPWFGKDYDACDVEVHGGLTYAATCQEPTRDTWERMRERVPGAKVEAAKHPKGDSARWLARFLPHYDDYEGWAKAQEGHAICHVPAPGRPARVWWLGFDCAHSGDLSPAYQSLRSEHGIDGIGVYDESYCDRAYVEREVASLARQLAGVTP